MTCILSFSNNFDHSSSSNTYISGSNLDLSSSDESDVGEDFDQDDYEASLNEVAQPIDPLSQPSCSQSRMDDSNIRSGDFGKVVGVKACRKFADHEKLFLFKHHFVPSDKYKFPIHCMNGHSRHFQKSWLEQYKGLVYSESKDGGYCKFCVLFGRCGPTMKQFGALVNRPLLDFKRATEKLSQHLGKNSIRMQ